MKRPIEDIEKLDICQVHKQAIQKNESQRLRDLAFIMNIICRQQGLNPANLRDYKKACEMLSKSMLCN